MLELSLEWTNANKTQTYKMQVDQVNLFQSNMRPGTDLWPNLCGHYDACDGVFKASKLFEEEGPPLELTLHNALKFGKSVSTCYVLRQAVMPLYVNGVFVPNDVTCDGRFSRKLHARREQRQVQLSPFWTPGPVVPREGTFMVPGLDNADSEDDDDDGCVVSRFGEFDGSIEAVVSRREVYPQIQYQLQWLSETAKTWETRLTFDVEWTVNFADGMSREQVIARFDQLDAAAAKSKERDTQKRVRPERGMCGQKESEEEKEKEKEKNLREKRR